MTSITDLETQAVVYMNRHAAVMRGVAWLCFVANLIGAVVAALRPEILAALLGFASAAVILWMLVMTRGVIATRP